MYWRVPSFFKTQKLAKNELFYLMRVSTSASFLFLLRVMESVGEKTRRLAVLGVNVGGASRLLFCLLHQYLLRLLFGKESECCICQAIILVYGGTIGANNGITLKTYESVPCFIANNGSIENLRVPLQMAWASPFVLSILYCSRIHSIVRLFVERMDLFHTG